jgi:hypothetical protein
MPALYVLFYDLFHLALDIAFLWINILMLAYIIKTNQRQHNKWVVTSLISCAISLLFRFIEIAHHFLGSQWTVQNYMAIDGLTSLEDVVGLVSTVFLWKVLRSAGFGLLAVGYPNQEGAGSGAWPPPPTNRP